MRISSGIVGEILRDKKLPGGFTRPEIEQILGQALVELVADETWGTGAGLRPERPLRRPREYVLPGAQMVGGRCTCPMCSLYRKGYTYPEITERLDLECSEQTVGRRMQEGHGTRAVRMGGRGGREYRAARIREEA